jgi:hypothetical protein
MIKVFFIARRRRNAPDVPVESLFPVSILIMEVEYQYDKIFLLCQP